MIEVIGWIGSLCFSLCVVPQCISCYKDKHAQGISVWFLLLWFVGEILSAVYVILTIHSAPIILNYAVNFCGLLIIIYYKIWGKRSSFLCAAPNGCGHRLNHTCDLMEPCEKYVPYNKGE